jgi:transcriptional repressor NrdR
MRCPQCGAVDTRVVDSRAAQDGWILRRRRHCDNCNARFTTHERVAQSPLIIVKKDGRREEFDPEKLRHGLLKACNKRPVAMDAVDLLVQETEQSLRSEAKSEVSAGRIGELVMEKLFDLDQVAYVRFASVYQRFDDVKRFAQLLERMTRRSRAFPQSEGKEIASDEH